MAADLWKCVLTAKDILLQHNICWCRTICVPLHKMLRYFESYKYISELALGPDDGVWEELGIPFVKSTWRDGSLDFTQPIHASDLERQRKHGGIFGTYEGLAPVIVISRVDMITDIMRNLKSFPHRRTFLCGDSMHNNILPMLGGIKGHQVKGHIFEKFGNSVKVSKMVPLMLECTTIMMRQILRIADDGEEITDGRTIFGVYAMDLIGRVIFGKQFPDCENPYNIFIQNATRLLFTDGEDEDAVQNLVKYSEFRKSQDCTFHPEAMTFYQQYFVEAFEERLLEPKGAKHEDVLQLLIECEKNSSMTREELFTQCTMLIALSYHSIAFTMAVACFEVSQNSDIQRKLQSEIDSRIAIHCAISDAAITEMKYLEMVLNEAMRKYPATVRIERVCSMRTNICNTLIPQGTGIAIPIYALHHDPEIYPEPETFQPERFAADMHIRAHLPFGESLLKSVVDTFAMKEMKVFMAYLLSRVTLLPPEDTRPLVLDSKNNILVAENIPFRVQKREIS